MSATTPRIVCSLPLPDAAQHRRLCEFADTVVATDPEHFAESVLDADGAVVIRPTMLDQTLIERAPRLRVVATVSSGVDHVDAAALARRGITLVSGGGTAPGAVAEWVAWAILAQRRQLAEMSARFAAGGMVWRGRLANYHGRELRGATVGIVGFGNIGRAVHKVLAPFGPHVLVFDPACGDVPSGVVAAESLDDLCERADAVTLHVPLTEATRRFVGERQLRLLGPTGLLVNAARGEIIDGEALLSLLTDGGLGAAAIDCMDPEPPDDRYLAALVATGRALVTPHVGGVSLEALEALSRVAVDGLQSALSQPAQ